MTTKSLSIPTLTLPDSAPGQGSREIPLIGFGTSSLKGTAAVDAVACALRSGYRLIDTASQYGNEASVGEGIRRSGIKREDVIVTTKVAGGDQGQEATPTAVRESLRRLGLDYIDILLIHWPNPSRGLAAQTWQAMLKLVDEGLVRIPGVSNFRPDQLTELHRASGVWPAMNQIQLSPALQRHDAVAFHAEHGIVTEAWGPLGGREGLSSQFVMKRLAAKYDASTAQIALRWAIDRNIVVIPKSTNPERQLANASLDHVRFDQSDLDLIATLDLGEEAAWDSREHEEW
ncbi:aldo/keto reductase [Devriesea agamarum]|uniref:aldo/keto reductase n=1 Tax=Devriesea agamarum TaxID=472569 RepID=UPI00071C4458|nr:aldo/keto reductase [Devriesea agamarum]